MKSTASRLKISSVGAEDGIGAEEVEVLADPLGDEQAVDDEVIRAAVGIAETGRQVVQGEDVPRGKGELIEAGLFGPGQGQEAGNWHVWPRLGNGDECVTAGWVLVHRGRARHPLVRDQWPDATAKLARVLGNGALQLAAVHTRDSARQAEPAHPHVGRIWLRGLKIPRDQRTKNRTD